MSETTPAECYGGDNIHAVCDGCKTHIDKEHDMYHCDKGKCSEHEDGYDYCLQCAFKQAQAQLTSIAAQDSSRLPLGVLEQYVFSMDRRALLGATDNDSDDSDNKSKSKQRKQKATASRAHLPYLGIFIPTS